MGAFDDLVPKSNNAPQEQQAAPAQQSGGAFDDLVPKQQAAAGTPQSSAFMAAVEGFDRSIGRTAEGVLQLAAPILPESFNKELAKVNRTNEVNYADTLKQHPIAGRVGEFTGYAAQEALLPVHKANILTKALSYGATGGGLMASQYGTGEERTRAGLLGGAASFLFGGAGELAWSGLKPVLASAAKGEPGILSKILTPTAAASKTMRSVIDEAGGLEAYAARTHAAERLGVKLRPSEAIPEPSVSALEKGIPIADTEDLARASQYLKTRDTILKSHVKEMIDNFVPEGEDVAMATRKKMYESLAPLKASHETASALFENPIINSEMTALKTNSRLPQALRDMPDNSVLKLDQIKKEIDSQLYNNKSFINGSEKTLGPAEKSALTEARSAIVNKLDAEYPEYAAARKVAERLSLKQQITEDLSKVAPKPGAVKGEITLDQMFDKLWSTPEKQQNFIQAVDRIGGDTNKTEDILQVLNQVRKSALETKVKSFRVQSGVSIPGIRDFANKLLDGRYNKALLKLSLDPEVHGHDAIMKLYYKDPSIGFLGKFKKILDNINNAKVSRKYGFLLNGTAPQAYTDTFVPASEDPREPEKGLLHSLYPLSGK